MAMNPAEIEEGLGRMEPTGAEAWDEAPPRSAPIVQEGSWITQTAAAGRASGATWQQIGDSINQRWDEAAAALKAKGVPENEIGTKIERAMGFNDPKPVDDRIRDHLWSALNSAAPATETHGVAGNIKAGIESSLTGMATNAVDNGTVLPQDLPTANGTFGERMGYLAGTALGDLPGILVGARMGSASVAFALPVAIKQIVTDAYTKGYWKSSQDAATRISEQANNIALAIAGGRAFELGGGLGAGVLSKFGTVTSALGTMGTQALGAMLGGIPAEESVTAIMNGQIPDPKELLDNSVATLLTGLAFHGAIETAKVVAKTPTVMQNIMDRWVATNAPPAQTATEAAKSPALYQELVLPPDPKVPPGSSTTPTEVPGENQIIVRPRGPFDEAVQGELQVSEPGTRYGVNAKIAPGVDLATLTPDSAAGIIHEKVWKPLGLEDFPSEVGSEVLQFARVNGIDAAKRVMDTINSDKFHSDLTALRTAREEQQSRASGYTIEPSPGAQPTFVDDGVMGHYLAIKGPDGEEAGSIGLQYNEATKEIYIMSVSTGLEGEGLAAPKNKLGPRAILGLRDQLHQMFPDATAISGFRVSGAREQAGKEGTATIKLPEKRATNADLVAAAKQAMDSIKAQLGEKEAAALPKIAEAVKAAGTAGPAESEDPEARVKAGFVEGPLPRPESQGFFRRIYQELVNKNSPALRWWRAVRGGGPVPADENFAWRVRDEETGLTRTQQMLRETLDDIKDSFKNEYQEFRLSSETVWSDFKAYMVALRARAEHKNGIENSIHPDDAQAVIDKYEAQYGKVFIDNADKIGKIRRKALTYMQEQGFLSEEQVEKYTKEPGYDLPGRKVSEPRTAGRPGAALFNPVYKMGDGTARPFADPIASAIADAFTRRQLADRNASILALARQVEARGDDALGKVSVFGKQKIPGMGGNGGPELEDPFDTNGEGPEEFINRSFGQLRDDQIPYFDNGIRRVLTIPDPDVVKVLRQYEPAMQSKAIRAMSIPARITRYVVVNNPVFPVAWTTADQLFFQTFRAGGLFGKDSAPANLIEGLYGTFIDKSYWNAAKAAGVVQDTFREVSRDELLRDLVNGQSDPAFSDRLHGVMNGLQWWTNHWMSAPKVGSYMRSMARGESDLEARVRASEAVFHRSAFGGPVGHGINMATPFFLAALNATEKSARMFVPGRFLPGGKEAGGENEIDQKGAPLSAWVKAASIITIPALIEYFSYHDQKWYQDLDPAIKDTHFIHYFGGTTGPDGQQTGGSIGMLRLPALLALVFKGLPRRVAENLEKMPDAWKNLAEGFASSLLPPGVEEFGPTFLQPALEVAANHSFVTGRPVVPDREMQWLPVARYTPYTTETAKAIARFIDSTPLANSGGIKGAGGISPIQVDHLISGWAGNIGLSAVRTVEQLSGVSKAPGTFSWSDLPMWNAIRLRYPQATSQPLDDFRGTMDAYSKVHATLLEKMKDGDLAGFNQVVEQYPKMAAMHRWALTNDDRIQMPANASEYMQSLRVAEQKLTPDQLQAGLNMLQSQKTIERLNTIAASIEHNPNHNMKPVEQSQLLDQTWLQVRAVADEANKNAVTAGFR